MVFGKASLECFENLVQTFNHIDILDFRIRPFREIVEIRLESTVHLTFHHTQVEGFSLDEIVFAREAAWTVFLHVCPTCRPGFRALGTALLILVQSKRALTASLAIRLLAISLVITAVVGLRADHTTFVAKNHVRNFSEAFHERCLRGDQVEFVPAGNKVFQRVFRSVSIDFNCVVEPR